MQYTWQLAHKTLGLMLYYYIHTTLYTLHYCHVLQKISRIKQTINISAFIDACKKLKVPEEEVSIIVPPTVLSPPTYTAMLCRGHY